MAVLVKVRLQIPVLVSRSHLETNSGRRVGLDHEYRVAQHPVDKIGRRMVEHHEVDFLAELGLDLRTEIEPERFICAARRSRFEQYRHVEIAAGPRFASGNAAEQIDRGDTLFTTLEGSPEPFG